jgi:hypothetical protein
MEKIKKLGIDWIQEVVDIVKKFEGSEPPEDTLPEPNEAWL